MGIFVFLLGINNQLIVLITGYCKSLIYQLLPSFFDYVDSGSRPMKSTVLIISPLNAIIRDQFHKLKETGLSVSVLKGEHVDADSADEEVHFPVELLKNTRYELVFGHPEVLVDSKKVAIVMKSLPFKNKLLAIIVDEARVTIGW